MCCRRLDPVRLAAAAHLARFKGQTRVHTESDLRAYLIWCVERGVDPLVTTRPYVELNVCSRTHRPSTCAVPACRRSHRPSGSVTCNPRRCWVLLPPAVSRAIDRAVGERTVGPILRNRNGDRMSRHAATRRLQRLQAAAGVRITRTARTGTRSAPCKWRARSRACDRGCSQHLLLDRGRDHRQAGAYIGYVHGAESPFV